MATFLDRSGEIFELNFTMDYSKLKSLGGSLDINNAQFIEQKTAKGDELVDFRFEIPNNGEQGSLLLKFNRIRNEVSAVEFKLKGRGYYQCDGVHGAFCSTMVLICCQDDVEGNFKAIDNDGRVHYISKGNIIQTPAVDIVKERVSKVEDIEEDDPISSYTIKVTIKEFLANNPDLVSELKTLGCNTFEEKLNAIGKKLIQMKTNDDISFELFVDLFRQCGIMGATDPAVLRFYQLLK